MSQFKKARKNGMKDSFYIKLATYLVPSPSRSIALGIWQRGRLQQKLIALHSNYTHASHLVHFFSLIALQRWKICSFAFRDLTQDDEFLLYSYTWISKVFKNLIPRKFANSWKIKPGGIIAMKFEIARIHFWVTFPNWESGDEGRTGIFPTHHSPVPHCARSHHPPLAPLARLQPPAFEIRASRSSLGEPVEKTSCHFFDSYRKIYRSDFNPANKQTALWHFTYPYQLLVNDGSNQSDIYPSTSLICHNPPIVRSCLSRLIEFNVIVV